MGESWADEADQAEIPLAGGDVTEGVVRIGDTVRRPAGPHSPLVHALLRHLEAAGFAKRREAWLERHAATLTAALTAP